MPQRVDILTELEAVNQVYINSGQRSTVSIATA